MASASDELGVLDDGVEMGERSQALADPEGDGGYQEQGHCESETLHGDPLLDHDLRTTKIMVISTSFKVEIGRILGMSGPAEGPCYPRGMIRPEQVRSARGLLGWTQEELARESGVSVNSLRGFENGRTDMRSKTLARIERALRRGGVLFLDDGEGSPGGGPGVRLKR